MADVESGALLSNGWKPLAHRSLAGAAFMAIALTGSGCSMFDQFNPFGGGEKYKMEVTPDVPASKTYDQGLDKLANGSPAEAARDGAISCAGAAGTATGKDPGGDGGGDEGPGATTVRARRLRDTCAFALVWRARF